MNSNWQPGMTMEDVERQAIEKAFGHYRGNKTHTAESLGIAIRTLDSKLAKYKKIDEELAASRAEQAAKRVENLALARGIVGKQPDEVTGAPTTGGDMPLPRGPQSKSV